MKKCLLVIIFVILIISCSQDPAEIEYGNSRYNPTYSETYIESPDGKMARNLRAGTSAPKNQVREDEVEENQVSIINEDYARSVRNNGIYKNYKVLKGDNLYFISVKFNSNVEELARINNIKSPYNIYVGQIIKVPDRLQDISEVEPSRAMIYYTVEAGDNLTLIAKKYNTSISDITETNGLKKPYNIYPGQKLKINTTGTTKSVESLYVVKSGDNLSSIAVSNNMSTEKLAKLNNLKKPYNIYAGQKLKLITTETVVANNTVKSNDTKTVLNTYTVKAGDNLSSIASKNNMSTGKLAEINNLKKPYNIYAGQKLKLDNSIAVVSTTTTKTVNPVVTSPITTSKAGFAWPIRGEVISKFGSKPNGSYNDGINISGTKGEKIAATNDGVISYVGNEIRAYGTIILIKHSNNWISVYGHCDTVTVARGDKVKKGEAIGTVGKTGSVNSPQLYFALRKGEKMVDPLKYLPN